MRHTLTILKYVPAVLCGLLVGAWVVSLRSSTGAHFRGYHLQIAEGAVKTWYATGPLSEYAFVFEEHVERQPWLGQMYWTGDRYFLYLSLPLAFVLSFALPFAIGPFNYFRFPLWSYFAWTALVAAELAYYLRA